MPSTMITYQTVELEVDFEYEPGFRGDYTDPPYPPSADISKVWVGHKNIYRMLTDEQIEDIQELVCEAYAEDEENA